MILSIAGLMNPFTCFLKLPVPPMAFRLLAKGVDQPPKPVVLAVADAAFIESAL